MLASRYGAGGGGGLGQVFEGLSVRAEIFRLHIHASDNTGNSHCNPHVEDLPKGIYLETCSRFSCLCCCVGE